MAKETLRKIICLKRPNSLVIRDVYSGTELEAGETVSVFYGQEFLGYGKITNISRDLKLNGFRHDVEILNDVKVRYQDRS